MYNDPSWPLYHWRRIVLGFNYFESKRIVCKDIAQGVSLPSGILPGSFSKAVSSMRFLSWMTYVPCCAPTCRAHCQSDRPSGESSRYLEHNSLTFSLRARQAKGEHTYRMGNVLRDLQKLLKRIPKTARRSSWIERDPSCQVRHGCSARSRQMISHKDRDARQSERT